MQDDLIQGGLAFLYGFALIISPCILPIFPIGLSSSLTASKARSSILSYAFMFG